MRQSDYSIGKALRRRSRCNMNLLLALHCNAPALHTFKLMRKASGSTKDVSKIRLRSVRISSVRFNINVFSEEQALKNFRFRVSELSVISNLMGWTGPLTKRNRYRCDMITAACIRLRKLASPCRWSDIEYTFGMRASAMSEIFWEVIESFMHDCEHLLETFPGTFLSGMAAIYAAAVHDKGAALDNCIGFIDCTKIQMSRPGGDGVLQRTCYSGHKRFHCLIYQTVLTPDGLIAHLYGPEVGRRHDLTLYRQSGIDEELSNNLLVDGPQYCLYGDAAYILRAWLQVAFVRIGATEEEAEYNRSMSAVREAVEWGYKDVKKMFSSQDYKRLLRVGQAPNSLMYKAAALLWNFKVCLGHGGQVGAYFGCSPPSLSDYTSL